MDLAKLLGARVREQRTALGLTQDQLAERVGTSNDEVSRIERGVREPRFATLERLSRALDLTVADLFRATGTSSNSPPKSRETAEGFKDLLVELRRLPAGDARALVAGMVVTARALRQRRATNERVP
jgi:transcriptional regulator with XRE-family HTH domain